MRKAAAPQGLVELVPIAAAASGGGKARYVLEMAGARLEFGDDVKGDTSIGRKRGRFPYALVYREGAEEQGG